ncbi:adenylate/guanylate cyclase domain-containing protein [Leptospira gomenensis]|uniref:Adenylate/guanylate cyclase domain-containing protein n=1 Tax=Leptospira gomenensis TaxID=2484974 RepID=A0A5F1YK81_9LEPT|nr:adenylate/guanylate cyclase domain-containing protein [Leptospira gomenensis]TGK33306.1 adenylate/guanylate cyclase domain-containing protein [Leptospira gomenensis]TGK37398.1 adenylate/guanylate cyclase domain-containing protein [Leptospira gomenensis]TGK50886.1 adenylate/guanylate cyclase domain-containing protein [Leptospira gomenensis]TGK56509.1 adenylate/guanylate cyclase domain-containing protein [Leptospira gomenensis]
MRYRIIIVNILFVFCIVSILFCGGRSFAPTEIPKAERGILDLREWDFENEGPALLEGEFRFLWNELSDRSWTDVSSFATVPKTWVKLADGQGANYPSYGFATYFLKIKLPPSAIGKELALQSDISETAYEIYANSRKLGETGTVSKTAESAKPVWNKKIFSFFNAENEIELKILISNFHHARGGLTGKFYLGLEPSVQSIREKRLSLEVFVFGSLAIMALYHLTLFYLRREEKSVLYFGLLCLVYCFRALSTGENLIQVAFPDLDYAVHSKIVYLSFYLTVPIFAAFFRSLFPSEFPTYAYYTILSVGGLASSTVLITSPAFFTGTIDVYYAFTFSVFFYGFYVLVSAVLKKRNGAFLLMGGLLVFFALFIQDTLYNKRIINTGYFSPIGLLAMLFSQAFLLARRYSQAFGAIVDLTTTLNKTNNSYGLFVPREFLKILNENDFIDVKLGDTAEEEMTILYNEIRPSQFVTDRDSAKENFEFINSYLGKVGPLIRDKNGFIDKYFGDAFLSLFSQRTDDALESAVQIQSILREINTDRIGKGKEAVRVGSGIHRGPIVLGTIGEAERMEGAVMSASVTIATRVGQLCRLFDSAILITDHVLFNLETPEKYHTRVLDRIQLKGHNSVVTILEVFNGQPDSVLAQFMDTKEEFERGISLFRERNFEEACVKFNRVLERNKLDRPARWYLEKSIHYCRFGSPNNWDGITVLDV